MEAERQERRREAQRKHYLANREEVIARSAARKRRVAAEKQAEAQRIVDAGLKVCARCHGKKSVVAFYGGKGRADGLYPYCKPCARSATRAWYARTDSDPWERHRTRREAAVAFVLASKKGRPCSDCGAVLHPTIMHYHHLDPTTKVGTVASLASQGRVAAVQAEIAKCVLLCANCHGLRHVEEEGA